MRKTVDSFRSAIACALVVLATLPASTASAAPWRWGPTGIVPTSAALADVLAANARASGNADATFGRRRERWTYRNGDLLLPVDVGVRDDDFRTSIVLDGDTYLAGRGDGVRWNADGNGVAHDTRGVADGDALDRAPNALFRLRAASCALVGEVRLPAPAWVVRTDRSDEKPAYLYIDQASGSIVREATQEGRHVVVTTFDRFEAIDGFLRARHWRVDDGDPSERLEVTVDAIAPGGVARTDVARPTRRNFATQTPEATVELPAKFDAGRVDVTVDVAGKPGRFVLDTGTSAIVVSPTIAARFGGAILGHAVVPSLTVGGFSLDRVSAFGVPLGPYDGILGHDFFFGHVVEIDYPNGRVRVLSTVDAARAFADPATTVVPANVDDGLPLVSAGIATARSDAFAVDTGSTTLYVMRSFASRFASQIAASWTPVGHPVVQNYVEGNLAIDFYRVPRFDLASVTLPNATVGVQDVEARANDLDVPFDGIIGTDMLRNFDVFFDYDGGRIGLRR